MKCASICNFTFVNENLDCYLNALASNPNLTSVPSKESRACALPSRSTLDSTPRKAGTTSFATSVTREFEGPKSVSCFDYEIKLSSPIVDSVRTKFIQEPCGNNNIKVLTSLRFPPKLKTCYVKDFDYRNEIAAAAIKKAKSKRKSGKSRLSLSEFVRVNDENFKKKNLLPTSEDIQDAYDKTCPYRRIPYIFGCSGLNSPGHQCAPLCAQKVEGFRLFMEVPQDGRPLHPIVRRNLEKLRSKSEDVDNIAAMMAVSAVRTSTPSTTRLFVPVSEDLLNSVGVLSEVFGVGTSTSHITVDFDPEVTRVVDDIVNFVVRQSEFQDTEYDPNVSLSDDVILDGSMTASPNKIMKIRKRKRVREKNKVVRELKKLLNITVKYESDDSGEVKGEVCDEPSCVLGCICSSLNSKAPTGIHCGEPECMFQCNCGVKRNVERDSLSKYEKTWHQTVVQKGNNAVEIKSGIERSKRQSKLPSRYKNSLTSLHWDTLVRQQKKTKSFCEDSDAEFEAATFNYRKRRRRTSDESLTTKSQPVIESPKKMKGSGDAEAGDSIKNDSLARPCKKPSKTTWSECTNLKRSESLKKKFNNSTHALNSSRLELCGTNDVKNLGDVFVWCAIHNKYDCHCANYVVLTRNSNLLLKASRTNRYSARKLFSQKSLKSVESPENRTVVLWDEKHCARSVGALLDYTLRNETPTYKEILKNVMKKKALSFSNGYVKTKPVATLRTEELYDNFPLTRAPSRGIGKIVKVTNKRKATVEIIDQSFDDGDTENGVQLSDNESISRGNKDARGSNKGTYQPGFSIYSRKSERSVANKELAIERSKNKNYEALSKSSEDSSSRNPHSTSDDEANDGDPIIDSSLEVYSDPELEIIEDEVEIVSINSSDDSDVEEVPISPSERRRIEPPRLGSPITLSDDDDVDDNADSSSDVESESDSSSDSPITSAPSSSHEPSDSPGSYSKGIDYPKFGLCNLKHTEFGFVPLIEDGSSEMKIAIPHVEHGSKVLRNAKEASDYMSELVEKYFGILQPKQDSEWCKVTRGVLQTLKCKLFPNQEFYSASEVTSTSTPATSVEPSLLNASSQIATSEESPAPSPPPETPSSLPSPVDSSALPSLSQKTTTTLRLEASITSPKVAAQEPSKAAYPAGNEKIVKRCFDLKNSVTMAQQDSSSQDPVQTISPSTIKAPSDGKNESTKDIPLTSAGGAVVAVVSPLVPASNLVGTFSSLGEANSFLEKNFPIRVSIQGQQVIRHPGTSVAYTPLKTLMPAGSTPVPQVSSNDSPTYVPLVRNAKMLPQSAAELRKSGVKFSTNSAGIIRMVGGNLVRCNLVRPSFKVQGQPQTPSLLQAKVLGPSGSAPGVKRVVSPGNFHLIQSSSTPVTLRCSTGPFISKPEKGFVPPGVRLKTAPRRADVIIPRDSDFATVISPAPSSPQVTPKPVVDSKVVYNGVIITANNSDLFTGPKAVICDKPSSTKPALSQSPTPTTPNQ